MKTLGLALLLMLAGCGQVVSDAANEQAATGIEPEETATVPSERTQRKAPFLWREKVYEEQLQDSVSTIVIDEKLAGQLTAPERAALGYVVTFIGSDCDWDGNANSGYSNLKCMALSALRLGYQCSDQHLGFLKNWFRNDQDVLSRLASCPRIPNTASSQQTFDEITLTTKGDTIKVWFKASGMNLPVSVAWDWSEENIFFSHEGGLKLVEIVKSEVNKSHLDIGEGF